MPMIDLIFPVLGTTVPTDHAYSLYAALTKLVPVFHRPDTTVAIASIRGDNQGDRVRRLDPRRSKLRLRLPTEEIPTVLLLAGKALQVDGHRIRL